MEENLRGQLEYNKASGAYEKDRQKAFLKLSVLKVGSPARNGTLLEDKDPKDAHTCHLWRYDGGLTPSLPDPGPRCFGRIGAPSADRAGKFCLRINCPVASHNKLGAKFSPQPGYYYLVNKDDQLICEPCFEGARYEGSEIWNTFRDNCLHPEGWLLVKSMLDNQVQIDPTEEVRWRILRMLLR
jgi:hypothetical protein